MKEWDHSEDLKVDGMIILDWILGKYSGNVRPGCMWLRIVTGGGIFVFHKSGEFFKCWVTIDFSRRALLHGVSYKKVSDIYVFYGHINLQSWTVPTLPLPQKLLQCLCCYRWLERKNMQCWIVSEGTTLHRKVVRVLRFDSRRWLGTFLFTAMSRPALGPT